MQTDANADRGSEARSPHDDVESVARRVAEGASVRRKENGEVDVLATVGGWRGLAEAILPGLVFIVVFTLVQQLVPALVAAVMVAAAFTIARLAQRQSLTQALAGLAGVVICALFSGTTGEARDYYVPGFFTNVGYAVALVASIALKWPLMGLVLGYIRGEGIAWRQDSGRARRYAAATWILVGVFVLRLAVQVPLYFAAEEGGAALTALGTARLIMGVPLYAMGLWLAWSVSRDSRPVAGVRRGDS